MYQPKSKQYISILLFMLLIGSERGQDYHHLWRSVYDYELKGLPRSAWKQVDTLYTIAVNDHDAVQRAKCVIYQAKFIREVSPDWETRLFGRFEQEIKVAEGFERMILHNRLATIKCLYAPEFGGHSSGNRLTVE